jgi:hypothetical protein
MSIPSMLSRLPGSPPAHNKLNQFSAGKINVPAVSVSISKSYLCCIRHVARKIYMDKLRGPAPAS